MPTAIAEFDHTPAMTTAPHSRKAVVVHAGARDAYQLALALSEAGLLEALVTDLFLPVDYAWAGRLAAKLSASLALMLSRRSAPIPSSEVRLNLLDGLCILALEKLPRVPLALRRKTQRQADANLGKAAGKLARRTQAGLITYSYYGFDAMQTYRHPAMLFQVHPHPATMRRILTEELTAHPDCAASLQQEWELALPAEDFNHLVGETSMAVKYIVASSFTRTSLLEHGTRPEDVAVIPYGVDLDRFKPPVAPPNNRKLELLFVGRINQRKGIKYLLEALRLMDSSQVHLTICGRIVDDLALFKPYADQITIRPSVATSDLIQAYQTSDLFVFPSVAEGFAQVLLESLACGLPILSTTHTAAPDLIQNGLQGFVIEPRRPDLLAERIEWAITHRAQLMQMRSEARRCAENFTWQRFRTQVAKVASDYLDTLSDTFPVT
jgi:glycosyltransferase involved in cell wall biosynthesis